MGLLNRRNQDSVEDNHLNAHECMYVKWCSIKDTNLHEMILVVSTNHSKIVTVVTAARHVISFVPGTMARMQPVSESQRECIVFLVE
jgi:hypothetical protein